MPFYLDATQHNLDLADFTFNDALATALPLCSASPDVAVLPGAWPFKCTLVREHLGSTHVAGTGGKVAAMWSDR